MLLLKKKHLLSWLILFVLLVGIWKTQVLLDSIRQERKESEVLLYFPSGKYLSTVSLGYDQVIADMLWIRTTTYFGTHLMTDQNYPWLYNMLDVLTSLDANFSFPYIFGGIILSLDTNQVEKSNMILKKGMKVFPDLWRFPFYIGFNYYYHMNDPALAGQYLEIAANHPDSPAYIKTFAATIYTKAGKKKKSIEFLKKLYNNADNELLKERIKKKIISHQNAENGKQDQ